MADHRTNSRDGASVTCDLCGGRLRFDVDDPQRLGRSMQACETRACPRARPHPLTRDRDFLPLATPPGKKERKAIAIARAANELAAAALVRPKQGPRMSPGNRAPAVFKPKQCLRCLTAFQPRSGRQIWCDPCREAFTPTL